MTKKTTRPQSAAKKTAAKKPAPKKTVATTKAKTTTVRAKTATPAKTKAKPVAKKTTSSRKTTSQKTTVKPRASAAVAKPVPQSSSGKGGWAFLIVLLILICICAAFYIEKQKVTQQGGGDRIASSSSGMQDAKGSKDQSKDQKATSISMADIVGIFQAELPAASSPGRVLKMQFDNTGEVTFTQDYLNGAAPITELGTWTFDDQAMTVTALMSSQDGMAFDVAREMIFEYQAGGVLTLINDDDLDWGTDGLSLTKLTDLTLNSWQWEKSNLANGEVSPARAGVFTITFNPNGSVNVTTDCNGGRGSYTQSNADQLSLGPLATTMMFCEGSQESVFNSQLAQVESYEVQGDELILGLAGSQGEMVFKAVSE